MDEKIKDKSTAPVQITAEQLIREAAERLGGEGAAKKLHVDKGDVQEYRLQTRRQCEDAIRRNRSNIGNWLKYARFEIEQEDFARARSVYERALDVDPRNVTLWLKYTEMEMSCQNVNLARNIWDRVVTILPRMDQFWFKYIKMEETLGEIERAREVWNRWLGWEPDDQIFIAAIKFEQRYEQWEYARARFNKFCGLRPHNPTNWILFSKFEEADAKNITNARAVFERAMDYLNDQDGLTPKIFIEFAKFEARQKEIERARAIYKLALEKFPPHSNMGLFNSYAQFEKAFGDPSTIDLVIYYKRKKEYEIKLKETPHDYDAWIEYTNLLINSNTNERDVKGAFEEAISQKPPIEEKIYWRRYIYLWLFYALYLELNLNDRPTAKLTLERCLEVIPHKKFTFAKIWNELAELHVRNMDLQSARKVFGTAIGIVSR